MNRRSLFRGMGVGALALASVSVGGKAIAAPPAVKQRRLKVPHLYQIDTSLDCVPTCVLMSLTYLGIQANMDELKAKLVYEQYGTSVFDNGSAALSYGVKATVVNANPLIFKGDQFGKLKTRQDILQFLDTPAVDIPELRDLYNIFHLNMLRRFLVDGGQMKVEIPSLQHIVDAIDAGSPVACLIYGQALGHLDGHFHTVIVSGYRLGAVDEVYVLNPLRHAQQGWLPAAHLLFALHSMSLHNVNSGTMLILSR